MKQKVAKVATNFDKEMEQIVAKFVTKSGIMKHKVAMSTKLFGKS